jgi:ubiquinone/menaquinone biosynthesis C-methylase UbiE
MESELILHSVTYECLSKRHSLIPWGDEHPTKVLDLGTGCGAWCLDAAREWKNAEFIGLDMVPCQTPLAQLTDPDLQKRISWVVANFLEELPFPTASFDFVHVRFVGAYSLQEDQWDAFLTEMTRVLKPDGRLEVVSGRRKICLQ